MLEQEQAGSGLRASRTLRRRRPGALSMLLFFQGALALAAAAPSQAAKAAGTASAAKPAPAGADPAGQLPFAAHAGVHDAASPAKGDLFGARALAPALGAAQPARPAALPAASVGNASAAPVPALSAAQPAAHSAAHLADGSAPHPAAQPAAQSLAHAEANPVVHSAALAAVHPAPQPDLAPRFRGAAKSSARYRGPAVQYSTAAPVPSQHAGSALGDVAGASHLSKFYNVFNSGVWWVVFGAFDSMSLWVTAFLVIAIAAILLFLCMLIRP